jgi:hypothetical protein
LVSEDNREGTKDAKYKREEKTGFLFLLFAAVLRALRAFAVPIPLLK